jgi:uncharacterized membrane protein
MPDKALRADDRRFRWLALGILGGTAALLTTYGVRHGWSALAGLPPVAGSVWISKLTIFSGAIEGNPYDPWTLGLVAWVLDLLASLLLLSGLGQLERLPLTGTYLTRTRRKAFATLLRYPGLERMAIGATTFFVFLPLPGSGSVFGTLIGQITGLPRTATLLAVGIGTGVAVVTYAAAAQFLGEQWETIAQSPWMAIGSLALLLFVGWLAWQRVRHGLRQV